MHPSMSKYHRKYIGKCPPWIKVNTCNKNNPFVCVNGSMYNRCHSQKEYWNNHPECEYYCNLELGILEYPTYKSINKSINKSTYKPNKKKINNGLDKLNRNGKLVNIKKEMNKSKIYTRKIISIKNNYIYGPDGNIVCEGGNFYF